MKFKILLCLVVIAGLSLACPSEQITQKKDTSVKPAKQSAAQTAIESFTGKTAVDAGKRAEKKIEAINAQRNQDYDDILGEE